MTNRAPDGWQLVEHHKLALGGVLFGLDMRAGDARALDALLRLPIATFMKAMTKYAISHDVSLADGVLALVHAGGDVLSAKGAALEFERRRQAYIEDRASWQRSDENGTDREWRRRYMTKGQRFLIAHICTAQQIAPPRDLKRGTAADWLEAHDAHPLYRDDRE